MGLIVYWTQFAEDKLEDIFNYYVFKASIRVAGSLVDGIVEATLDLDKNPLSGQIEPNLSNRVQEFRYLIYKNYKIVYWIDTINEMVLISNVFDTRQNPQKLNRTP